MLNKNINNVIEVLIFFNSLFINKIIEIKSIILKTYKNKRIKKKYYKKYLNHSKNLILKYFKYFNINISNLKKEEYVVKINRANKKYSEYIIKIIKGINPVYKFVKWNTDFFSEYQWDNTKFFKEIKKVSNTDIKIPLEISRCQFLFNYILKKNIKELKCLMLDFIAINPPYYGVSWKCTMDVAVRAVNFCIAFDFIYRTNKEQNEEFNNIIYSSLFDHLYFIKNNLERYFGKTNNHYLADISGLLILSNFLNKKNIFKFALKELKKEANKQFYKDGINFEASTCYHRYGLELIFYPCYFMTINHKDFKGNNYKETADKIFGNDFVDILYKAFDSFLYLLKPNGYIPQIGDNDNGQFIKLYPRETLDMRYILALGGVFFKESKWKIKEFFKTEEDIAEIKILYGESGIKIWNKLISNNLSDINSKAFKDSGWYVMRNNTNYMITSCGSNGQNKKGGHAHNDKLSFELYLNEDIVVDPGTYVYTLSLYERNKFRSTSFHNTIMIDSIEQNNLTEKFFYLEDRTKAICTLWENHYNYDRFKGEHYGFRHLGIVCKREILFNKINGKIVITDEIIGEGEHKIEWYFNILNNNKIINKDMNENIVIGEYSKEYMNKKNIDKKYFTINKKLPYSTKFTLNYQ